VAGKSCGATVAITRGARGATILTSDARFDVPAAPAREADPTGAGYQSTARWGVLQLVEAEVDVPSSTTSGW